jgi:hypothetical protein
MGIAMPQKKPPQEKPAEQSRPWLQIVGGLITFAGILATAWFGYYTTTGKNLPWDLPSTTVPPTAVAATLTPSDNASTIQIRQVKVVSEKPEFQLEINGTYDLSAYGSECQDISQCSAIIVFKSVGKDAYYPRADLMKVFQGQKGNWNIRIDVLASPLAKNIAPSICKEVDVFDPQQEFEVYVIMAPKRSIGGFLDCIPTHLGFQFKYLAQASYFIGGGTRINTKQ